MAESGSETGLTPLSIIDRAREIYGPVQIIEIEAKSLTDAHRQLGEAVKQPLHKFLDYSMNKYSLEQWQGEQDLAREFLNHLETKRGDEVVGGKINAYLESLSAWAEGAEIVEAVKKSRPDLQVNSALELALQLQNDNSGCITVIAPQPDGSVLLLHTEEAEQVYKSSVDKLRITAMKIGDRTYYSFTYTNLLPGGAFAWNDQGRFIASDSLYLKTPDAKNFRGLANTAVWMLLFSDSGFEKAGEIIEVLGPYYDGYVVNLVDKGQIKKIAFAHNRQEIIPVSFNKVSDQVNILPPSSTLHDLEKIDPRDKQSYERRKKLLERLVSGSKAKISKFDLDVLTRLLSFRVGGEDGIVSGGWVKAGVAAEIGKNYSQIRVIGGPARRGDNYLPFTATY